MEIKRTIAIKDNNGTDIVTEVEVELTDEELLDAHEVYVTNFMQNELENKFGYSTEIAEELAVSAYMEYTKGDGLTEYECIEKIIAEYEDEEWT